MTRTKKPGQPATRILQRDRLLQSSGLVQDAPTKKTPPRNNGKHPGGRPSNYDPDYHPAKVLEGMQQGMSLNEAALNAGISAVAQWKWQQDDTKPEFQKAVKEGLRAAEVWWERHARENIGNSKFNAVLWMMNMSNRFGWKRKDDVSVNANSTVTHEIKFEHDEHRAAEVARILEAIGGLPARPGTGIADDAEADKIH